MSLLLLGRVTLLLSAITGFSAAVSALVLPVPAPVWVLILVMISASSILVFFISIILAKHTEFSRLVLTALILFTCGSFGGFLSALNASQTTSPSFLGFLALALTSDVLSMIGVLFLFIDALTHQNPKSVNIVYFVIFLAVGCLFAGSLSAYFYQVTLSKGFTMAAFSIFLVASVANLFAP